MNTATIKVQYTNDGSFLTIPSTMHVDSLLHIRFTFIIIIIIIIIILLTRCIVCNTVFPMNICPSVHPSVRLSVCQTREV